MASTCVWFPYPDSACLVLGCVRVCVLPQRLSKGKCIGSILDESWAASRCVLLNRQKSHPQRLACAWPLLSPEAVRMRFTPSKVNDGTILVFVDLSEINYKPLPTRSPAGDHPITATVKARVEALQAELMRLELRPVTARTSSASASVPMRSWPSC
jgi:hypothetical protein